MTNVREAITRAHHEEWVRVVASLARRFGEARFHNPVRAGLDGMSAGSNQGYCGRGWDRTSDLPLVRRVLSR